MARPPLPLETWGNIRKIIHRGKPTAVVYYRASDGKRRLMQRSGRSKADAERKLLKALRTELSPASDDLQPSSPVNLAIKHWEIELANRDLATGTKERYRRLVSTVIIPGLGAVRLNEANVPRTDRFLKSVQKAHGQGTARTTRTVLNQIMGLAVRHGAIKTNPIRDTAKISSPRNPVKAPTPNEIRKIMALLKKYDEKLDKRGNPKFSDLYDSAIYIASTAQRTGEVLALLWTDLRLEVTPATATVTGTLIVDELGKLTRQPHPKSESGFRTLDLTKTCTDMLLKRRVSSYSEYVFPSSTGTARWPNNYRRMWRDALKGSPFEGVTPIAFRKAVATQIRDAMGVDAAKDQLGHSSSQVTSKHYVQKAHQGPAVSGFLEELFFQSND